MGNWEKLPVTVDKGFILLCTALDTSIAPMIVGIVGNNILKHAVVDVSSMETEEYREFLQKETTKPPLQFIDYYAKPAKLGTIEEMTEHHTQEHIRWKLIEMPEEIPLPEEYSNLTFETITKEN